jgi:hypothetical protein
MMAHDEYWAKKFGYLPDPDDEEMQRLVREYLESEPVRAGNKYEQLEALGKSNPRVKSLVLGRHTMVAANHGYGCICPSCEIYFATSTYEGDWEDGEFGPFEPEELSKVRELLGYDPIPEKYWKLNKRSAERFMQDFPDHQPDRGEP